MQGTTVLITIKLEEAMLERTRERRLSAFFLALSVCVLGFSHAGRAADVTVPGSNDFPESLTASADGSLFFSSMAGGRIFRAAPGEGRAVEWVKQGSNGLSSILGVLADDKSNNLYACSDDMTWAGIAIPTGNTPTALKIFDLKTGAAKGSVGFPSTGSSSLCNDIAIGSDGTVYVTDSLGGRILRLKPGAEAFEIWAQDDRWSVAGPQLDGIAVLPDGSVYANIFQGDGLYRIAVNADGSAGAITKLQTSRPLFHADGLRAFGPNKLLMVEGETKGTLDLITIRGETAQVDTIKGGFEGPVSVTQVGDTAYVLDVPLKYLFDAEAKKSAPPPFRAVAVKLAQGG
jgi:sugar lactone lactonase YvrE